MFRNRRFASLIVLAASMTLCFTSIWAQDTRGKPAPTIIPVNMDGKDYVRLLGGPPDSINMRSGAVMLQPGKTVGKHNTGAYEELIIVLEGQVAMILSDGKLLEIKLGTALYCPPDTEHDVKNLGAGPLRYIYVVAKTR